LTCCSIPLALTRPSKISSLTLIAFSRSTRQFEPCMCTCLPQLVFLLLGMWKTLLYKFMYSTIAGHTAFPSSIFLRTRAWSSIALSWRARPSLLHKNTCKNSCIINHSWLFTSQCITW
jgi:hypothetical protein